MRLCILIFLFIAAVSFTDATTLSLLKEAVERDPENMTLRRDLADEFVKEKYYSDAIREYKIIIEKGASDSNVVYNLSLAYFFNQDYKNALFYADTAANMPGNPNLAAIYYNISVVSYNQKDYESAYSAATKAYQYNPKDPDTLFLMGNLHYVYKKDYAAALDYYQMAEKLPLTQIQKDKNKRNIMASALSYAISLFNTYVLDTKSTNSNTILKYLQIVQDAHDSMSPEFSEKNSDLNEVWMKSYYIKSQIYVLIGDLQKAKKELFFIFDQSKEFVGLSDNLMNLGVLFYEKKDNFSAIECYARVMTLTDTDADTIFNIAVYYHAQGDWETALWYFERGLELDPTNTAMIRTMSSELDLVVSSSNQKGIQFFTAKKYSEAFIEFSKALYYRQRNDTALNFLPKIDMTQVSGANYFIMKAQDKQSDAESAAKLALKLGIEYFNKGEYIKSYEQIQKAIDSDYANKNARLMYLRLYPIVTARREEMIAQLNDLLDKKKTFEAEKMLFDLKPALDESQFYTYRERLEAIGKQKTYGTVESDFKTGERYFNQGNIVKARIYFKRVLKQDTSNEKARNYLNQITVIEQKQKTQLRASYDDAEKRNDINGMRNAVDQVLAYDSADTWALQKRAILDKNTAVSEEENKKTAHKMYLEGINKYTVGDYAGAIKTWQEVIKLAGNYKNVKEYIQRAEAKLKG